MGFLDSLMYSRTLRNNPAFAQMEQDRMEMARAQQQRDAELQRQRDLISEVAPGVQGQLFGDEQQQQIANLMLGSLSRDVVAPTMASGYTQSYMPKQITPTDFDKKLEMLNTEEGRRQAALYEQFFGPKGTTVQVGGDQRTPFVDALDKAAAADYLKYQSDSADAVKQMFQIQDAITALESGEDITGPIIGLTPDKALNIFNPQAVDVREKVEEVVQRNLRLVLGAQFTEKEGERLIKRAYNPNLPEEVNARRLRALLAQMSIAHEQRKAINEYLNRNRTMLGYEGKMPSVADFDTAINNAGTPRDASQQQQSTPAQPAAATPIPPGWKVEKE